MNLNKPFFYWISQKFCHRDTKPANTYSHYLELISAEMSKGPALELRFLTTLFGNVRFPQLSVCFSSPYCRFSLAIFIAWCILHSLFILPYKSVGSMKVHVHWRAAEVHTRGVLCIFGGHRWRGHGLKLSAMTERTPPHPQGWSSGASYFYKKGAPTALLMMPKKSQGLRLGLSMYSLGSQSRLCTTGRFLVLYLWQGRGTDDTGS